MKNIINFFQTHEKDCNVCVCAILCLLGGAHEGLQHLGPYGNIPNIVAELTGDNIPKDFSEDQGYPDPPNPCPIGKTGKLYELPTGFDVVLY